MKINFWKDYDKSSNDNTPLRIDAHSRTWFGGIEYTNLDIERINAYVKANNIDLSKTVINADFMNTMEEWYLSLAEKYAESMAKEEREDKE